MLKTIVVVFLFTVCLTDVLATTEQPTYCGQVPDELYECLGRPKIIDSTVASQCTGSKDECQRYTCLYEKAGWLTGSDLNKAKITEYFDTYARENAVWKSAVEAMKITCLDANLPAQGIHLKCPAYDHAHCTLTQFLRNTQRLEWPDTTKCRYSKAFAAACPVCPTTCFASQVPIGSCNACLLLPRSP